VTGCDKGSKVMQSDAFRDELAENDTQLVVGTGRGLKTTCRSLVTTEMKQDKRYSFMYRLWLRKASSTGSRASKVEKAVARVTARA
jgi:hypothetical protein